MKKPKKKSHVYCAAVFVLFSPWDQGWRKRHTLLQADQQVASGITNDVSPHVTVNLCASYVTLSNASSDLSSKVLLQSCTACSHGPHEGESLVVRVLYDSCSAVDLRIKWLIEQLS